MKTLKVCRSCRMGIESREGTLPILTRYVDSESEDESTCDWCEESGFDTLYEIIG